MSPSVTLSEETFAMLQALAEPFVDTPESVVSALARFELKRRGQTGNGRGVGGVGSADEEKGLQMSPDAHDDLTHSRLLSASVAGQPLHRPKWNGLLYHLHILGRQRLQSVDALRRASGANVREGQYEENGYRYLPDADLSVQGVDANLAWDHSLGLARALGVPIQVKLEWRQKDGAAHPGARAVIEWAPDGAPTT